jgi:hypothetical protein
MNLISEIIHFNLSLLSSMKMKIKENENNIFCHFAGPLRTLILESSSPSSHGIQGMITTKVTILIF